MQEQDSASMIQCVDNMINDEIYRRYQQDDEVEMLSPQQQALLPFVAPYSPVQSSQQQTLLPFVAPYSPVQSPQIYVPGAQTQTQTQAQDDPHIVDLMQFQLIEED